MLRDAGLDCRHVRDYGMQASADEAILIRAREEGRTIISADSDFSMLLDVTGGTQPSFLLFREPEIVRASDYAARILAILPIVENEISSGCVVTFRRGRFRVRRLPILR